MPKPGKDETQEEFIERCMPIVIGEGKDQDQAAAICYSLWRERDSKAVDETLVYPGGEVKALGDGRVGGYLVRFTNPDDVDLEGEYFDAATDYGTARESAAYYNHGMDARIGKRTLGTGALKSDDVGVWIEAQLQLRDEYEKAVYQLARAGKLGWSSGTAAHLVEKERKGSAVHITRWPLGLDASLTPTPAEPRNMAMPLKVWAESLKSLEVVPEVGSDEEFTVTTTAPAGTEVHVIVEQKPTGKATREVTNMEENEKTTPEKAPVVDVEAVAIAAAQQTVKTFWEDLKAEPGVNPLPWLTVTDESDRAAEGNPFKSFGEMAMAVKVAGQGLEVDKRLLPIEGPDGYEMPAAFVKAPTGLGEGAPAAGGFLVGTDERLAVIPREWAVGALLSRVSMFPVSGNSNGMTFNFENETSRAAGSRRGGVRGYWAAEAGTKTASQPEFRQVSMRLKKAVALVYTTDELLNDAATLEAYLMRVYPEELNFLVEDAIINGTGAGMPLGILASGADYSVAKETGQTAATVNAINIIKMWTHRYVAKTDYVWLLNQEVEAQLLQLNLEVGVGGQLAYMPPGGLSVAPYGTLFGRPVLPVEYCAALGTVGDIILMSPSEYYMISKGGVESASSIHVKFVNDETVFRFVLRVDGQPAWAAPLSPYKGTASSISPFVTLATRA